MSSSQSQSTNSISKDEREVYDRQIRLWGLEAQNKLRNSSVLLSGLTGLGAEVVKNLMLCGLKAMTLVDNELATDDDKMSNFLLEDDYLGKNRAVASAAKAQSLNPMVKLMVEECAPSSLSFDTLKDYDLVVYIDQPYDLCEKVDAECRKSGVRFVCGSVYGWSGYAFLDFNNHQFRVKVQKKNDTDVSLDGSNGNSPASTTIEDDQYELKKLSYPSMSAAFNVEWDGKQFLKKANRLLPSSYFPIRAMLRAESAGVLKKTEDDVTVVTDLWKKEIAICGRNNAKHSNGAEDIELLFGPQFSPVCAVVGGVIGQEAITALSENDCPLQNIFIYSAIDTTGTMCKFPPV